MAPSCAWNIAHSAVLGDFPAVVGNIQILVNKLINPNVKIQMPNQAQSSNVQPKYDLEERTAVFGENVIEFVQSLPKNTVNNSLISQLVRSATSIGANYMEADGAESKKDFRHKIGLCKKESREAKHFFRMSAVAVPEMADRARKLWLEAKELNLIFNAIYKKLRKD